MKRFYINLSWFIGMALMLCAPKAQGQCLVDYTTSNYFCDLDSLYLTAVPLGGTGPFTFIWETGETTQTIIIPLALGDYMLTMTDANGCTSIINCHVKPYPDVIYYPYNQNACEGDTVAIFLDWFRDSIPGATYLWSDGSTGNILQVTDDYVWSVTITDPATGCTFVIPPNLFDFHPTPQPQIVGPDMICNGQSVTLSATGGPFGSLVWYIEGVWEGFFGETFEVTGPGTYYVWGSSPEAGYCWNQDTIVITGGNIVPPILAGPPDLCTGQTGTVSVTNSSQYTAFIWSNGQTASSFTATLPGTYTVTVTNSEGCTASESITIDQSFGASIETDATGATCGQNTGAINLTPSPLAPYEYLWSNGATTQDISNIPPGSYSVTVTDNNGCTSTATEVVPDIPITITLTSVITPNNSCSNFNGAINISVSPVSQIYSYTWSNGATTEDIGGLVPGTYSVTITTGVNCSTTESFIVEDFSGAAEINPVVVPTTCGENNGSATVQLDGGIGPFTYVWSNGNTTESITNIPANTYTVSVTGADGCVSVATVIVPNEDPTINITADIIPNTSCSGANGEINISVMPAGAYSFMWSNGSTSEDLFNLSAGTYIVTVTLGNTCIESASFNVTNENIPFSISGNSTNNTSCSTPNGAIDLNIIPAGTYTYEWSTGAITEDINGLNAGSYTVTVTNASGCAVSSPFTIENTSSSLTVSGLTVANTSCQIPNGVIDISVTPSGTYTFVWSNGATTEDLQNIEPGVYEVTVTNTDGCVSVNSFTVENQSTSFAVNGNVVNNNSCSTPNGSVDITVTPAGTYQFAWSNGMTTEDLQFLGGGAYTVTITDGNGCSSVSTFTVDSQVDLPILTANIINEVCSDLNGAIDLTITGTGNTYIWSNGQTSEDLSGIGAGTYMVTITATNGCIIADTFSVTNTSNNFTLSGTPVDNSSCLNPNGSIDLQVTPAGTYTFQWSSGQTTEDLQNINNGTYVVTVTDALNCTSTASFDIQSIIVLPEIAEVITPASCGQANGSIELAVIPSTGNTYTWSNGSNGKDISNVPAGSYTVTVTTSGGCTTTATFVVPDNNSNFSVSGTVTENNSCTLPNGAIDLEVSPSGAYTFSWNTGATSEDLGQLQAGTYEVTVTDAFLCTGTQTFTVTSSIEIPEISSLVTPATCGQNNGAIVITVSITTGNSFIWSDGNTDQNRFDLLPGTYTVTVTASNGCSAIASMDVPNQNTNFTLSSILNNNTSCLIPTASIDLNVSPAGVYSFLWSNGSTTEDLSNIPSGVYQVTVTDQFNCATSEMFLIEDNTTPPVLAGNVFPPTCGNANGRIDLRVEPLTGNSFVWSTGQTSEDLDDLPAGTYTVTVTSVEGCTADMSFTVPGSQPIELTIDADLSSLTSGSTVQCSLQLNVPMGVIDSIIWSPQYLMSCQGPTCMEQSFIITETMNISVMAIDTNGCYGIAQLQLDLERDFKIYIPNVFRPNGDGSNDRFTVYTNEEILQIELLQIFDRWGNLVFENEEFPPSEPNYGWDGVFGGQLMNPAVFAYRAVVLDKKGGKHFYKGDVTLVR